MTVERVAIGSIAILAVTCIFGLVWFHCTHTCVRSHKAQGMNCVTANNFTTCTPVQYEQCDEYQESK